MKKIKITTEQAKLLGFNVNENEESGLKSVGGALGPKPVRVVIDSPELLKYKEVVLKTIAKQDPSSALHYFEATNKIVGTVSDTRFASIQRDLKGIGTGVNITRKSLAKSLKENTKSVIKITKEQYNRIFATKMINENDNTNNLNDNSISEEASVNEMDGVKGGLDRVNKQFLNKGIKPMAEAEGSNIKNETLELIKYLYRKSEEFPKFFVEKGLTYEKICDELVSKKLILSKNGKYEVSKSLGSPEEAISAIESAIQGLMGHSSAEETTTESNYLPAGAEDDPRAPYNAPEQTQPTQTKKVGLQLVAYNREIAILKDNAGSMYVFYYGEIDKQDFMEFASVDKNFVGKDEEGQPEFDYEEDFKIDGDVIERYINANLDNVSKGAGIEAYESGVDFVKIDDAVKNEILSLYDKDKNIIKALSPIDEMTSAASSGSFSGPMAFQPIKKDLPLVNDVPVVKEAEELGKGYTHFAVSKADGKIVTGWDYSSLFDKLSKKYDTDSVKEYATIDIKDWFPERKPSEFKVVTRESLKKQNIDPADSNNWATQGLNEMTTASAGSFQYDANALPGIKGDGTFKTPKKTKAQSKTQYAGGSFVKFNDCTKLNNKVSGTGCSSGAVDKVVKTQKTKSNVNAPSLGSKKV